MVIVGNGTEFLANQVYDLMVNQVFGSPTLAGIFMFIFFMYLGIRLRVGTETLFVLGMMMLYLLAKYAFLNSAFSGISVIVLGVMIFGILTIIHKMLS